jgi:NitT/TauT family transport system substrate-binding protein
MIDRLPRRRALAMAALIVLAALGAVASATAQPKGLRKVTFAFASKTVPPLAINLAIGESLGYYKEEGLTVDIIALGSNANVNAALDQKKIEFAVGVSAFQIPLAAKGERLAGVNYYEYTYPFKWDWAVKPDSPIKTLADLKGKSLGVANFGTQEQVIGKAMLAAAGVDGEKDVTWTAVGEGTTSGLALQKGAIDAVIYYDTGFGQWQAAGIPFKFLPRPANIPMIGGFYIQARPEFLKQDRQAAVGFARGVAKGTVFALENPDLAARIYLRMFPEARAQGLGEDQNVKKLLATLQRRMEMWKPYDPKQKLWGFIPEREWVDEIAFLGVKAKVQDPKQFFTNALIEEINRFDPEKIKAHARTFKLN